MNMNIIYQMITDFEFEYLNLSIFGAEKSGWENKLLFVLVALTEDGSKKIDGQFRSMRYKMNTLVGNLFRSIQGC